jgi:glycosyltransferase involved in cell wall biosynthesis
MVRVLPEKNEVNKNAMGGTELMANRIERDCNQSLLKEFQIIHSRVRDLDPNKKKILVLHDLPQDPEVQHLKDGGWEKYDKLVFVSHWQQEMYKLFLGVPYSAGVVLRNAIEPIEPHEKPNPKEKISLIYFSTPHRGLDILYAAFNQLSKEYDNLELNVFSSFQLYGWPQRDEPYKEMFDRLREHPKVNYHKSVPNDRIREELKKAHIFAYPSTWQETSCLCLIEAMSAGCLSIHSSLAALPETSMGLTSMYGYTEDAQRHANQFYLELKNAVELHRNNNTYKMVSQQTKNTKALADYQYSWKNRKLEWNSLMKSLLT